MKNQGEKKNPGKARGETIYGEARVGDLQSRAGPVSSAAVLSFAEDLIFSEAADQAQKVVVEVKITLFDPTSVEVLAGEASLVHRQGPLAIWKTDIREQRGRPVAQVFHTCLQQDAYSDASAAELAVPVKREKKNGAVLSAEERRETIAQAACVVIANKGFAASSIREIADAAGMHVPTMYQYVSSKEEVLELVYLWVMRRVRENVSEALASAKGLRQRLRAVTLKLIENNDQRRRDTGVLNRELRSLSKSARMRVVGEYIEVVGQIADVIAEGVEAGEFRKVNPVIVANFVDALCDMWALRQFAVGQYSVDEFREELLHFIECGLGAGNPGLI